MLRMKNMSAPFWLPGGPNNIVLKHGNKAVT